MIFSQAPQVCPVAEYFPDVEPGTGNELFWSLFDGNTIARDGYLWASRTPGLGVTVNQERAEELTVVEGDRISLD